MWCQWDEWYDAWQDEAVSVTSTSFSQPLSQSASQPVSRSVICQSQSQMPHGVMAIVLRNGIFPSHSLLQCNVCTGRMLLLLLLFIFNLFIYLFFFSRPCDEDEVHVLDECNALQFVVLRLPALCWRVVKMRGAERQGVAAPTGDLGKRWRQCRPLEERLRGSLL